MNPEEKLSAALRAADVVIAYTPIGDEPRFSDFLKGKRVITEIIYIPPLRENDAEHAAAELSATHADDHVLLFIPGREFDRKGTRHGRGGGWYDRFLANVPREWLRVGVLSASRLSKTTLARKPWDQPMDMLLVKDGQEWNVLEAETV